MAKTAEQIRAEIKATRDQLVNDVRGLSSEVHPSVIKQQTIQHVKDAAIARVDAAKALVVDDAGIRWDRIGTAVLLVASVVLVHGCLRRAARLVFH
jgi:hypothetical protein